MDARPSWGWRRQQPATASAGAKLTLSAARWTLAEKQNLDVAAARQQRAVALAGVKIAGERPNPNAAFDAYRNSPHEDLVFTLPLEVAGQRGKRIDLAKQESSLTEVTITAIELQIRGSVRDAYFALAFARATTAQKADAMQLSDRLHWHRQIAL